MKRQSSSLYGRRQCRRCSSLRGGSRTCCTRSRRDTSQCQGTTCAPENEPAENHAIGYKSVTTIYCHKHIQTLMGYYLESTP